MIPVILSGGSGTRLWPVSRKSHPKQFWPLTSDSSLLQETCNRLAGCPGAEGPLVICNADHRFFVADQLQQIGAEKSAIILEPIGRNTAPAITVAAIHALESHKGSDDEDPILLVLPADHEIKEKTIFWTAIEEGIQQSNLGRLVTFGVVPSYPETGYGYIQGGAPADGTPAALKIKQFVEKPDEETAESYLESGNFFWNSGMFMFRASCYLAAVKTLAPEIYAASMKAYEKATHDLDFIRLDDESFTASPSDSVDYAIMEKIDNGVVIPLDAGWNDVGSWTALLDMGEKDENGNVTHGDTIMQDTEACYLRSDGRLLATIGIKDQIIVETADAILVAHRDRVQDVKKIVSRLTDMQRNEATEHQRVCRPWGDYREIDRSNRYQVKRITVKPGASLSLQMHHHRAEHWVVVSGTARVTNGENVILLTENQSTYIPLGTKHRLENPGQILLELIEVQSGGYLGEDDIVRFDDVYGREKEV